MRWFHRQKISTDHSGLWSTGQWPATAVLRSVRWNPRRHGAVALVVLALLVLGGLTIGKTWWHGRDRAETVPMLAEPSASAASSTEIVVSVSGQVHRPGLVRLRTGARVADAITAAGDLLPGAQLGQLNLARKLRDGELVLVGVAGESAAPAADNSGESSNGSLIDLNQATVSELDALPGVGPVLAQRILDYRTAHGGFRSVDELRRVDGIGESRFARLRDVVTV